MGALGWFSTKPRNTLTMVMLNPCGPAQTCPLAAWFALPCCTQCNPWVAQLAWWIGETRVRLQGIWSLRGSMRRKPPPLAELPTRGRLAGGRSPGNAHRQKCWHGSQTPHFRLALGQLRVSILKPRWRPRFSPNTRANQRLAMPSTTATLSAPPTRTGRSPVAEMSVSTAAWGAPSGPQ